LSEELDQAVGLNRPAIANARQSPLKIEDGNDKTHETTRIPLRFLPVIVHVELLVVTVTWVIYRSRLAAKHQWEAE
jgi:hypothetical protein